MINAVSTVRAVSDFLSAVRAGYGSDPAFTSQQATKALHRWAEQALIEAELWAATAAVQLDAEYPYDEFDRLWQLVLLHEFHDILPGTSIAWVHREAVEVLSQVLAKKMICSKSSLGGGGVEKAQGLSRQVRASTPVQPAGNLSFGQTR